MRRLSFALFCGLLACTSTEKKQLLANYQQNAALYFEDGRLDQSMAQIEHGLDIAPNDYKLRAMRGAIWLKTSGNADGTDHRRLDLATEELAAVHGQRSDRQHEPYLLLNYALARQKQGHRLLGEAIRLDAQAQRTNADRAPAEQARQRAQTELQAARTMLAVLIERGEVLRSAYKHQFQVAADLGDHAGCQQAADAYFAQLGKEVATAQQEVERTNNLAYEKHQVELLQQLKNEELLARDLAAHLAFDQRDYARARSMLDRVLELDPSRSVDYYNRGRVLLELQEAELAKVDFRKFLATTNLPASSEKTALALRALQR